MPRIVEEQRAILAHHLELVAGCERQSGVKVGHDFVGTQHRSGEHDIDAVAPDHLLGTDPHGLAGDQPGAVHAVAAHVHQRSAVELRAEADVRRLSRCEAERSADQVEPTHSPAPDQLLQPTRLRIVAVHERLHQQPLVALRGVESALHVLSSAAEGLLAQDVLAGLERAHGPLDVHRVGHRDVDDLDIRVVQQRLVATVSSLDSLLARVALRSRGVAARDGHDLQIRRLTRPCQEQPVDPRGREDSPFDGHQLRTLDEARRGRSLAARLRPARRASSLGRAARSSTARPARGTP